MNILIVNYLCEPGRGSERGAGWGMLQVLRRLGKCTVLTNPESGRALVAWNASNPDDRVDFLIVDEPWYASILKRVRVGEFLVYLAWQRRARRVAAPGAAAYDVACHATLSAFWLPSVAPDFGIPSVWGPVGGAVTTPRRLWSLLGWKGILVEIIDWIAVRTMSSVPATRRTWKAATVRLAQNPETVDRLPQQLRASSRILNHALFHQVDGDDLGPRSPKFLQYVAWVSPVESRKGPELAVRALAATPPGVSMVLVGDGPELGRIQRLAASLGVADRIDFTGRVPHDDALRIIRDAAVVMFTGLREEGGLALAEAMLLGTPVVVLGNGGASVIAGAAVNPDRVSIVAPTTVDGTVRAMAAAVEAHFRWGQEEGGGERLPLIDVGAAQARLAEALEDAVASTGRGST